MWCTTFHIDYHVEIDGHYYSVPHALVRRQLDIRLTAHTVECFHRGQRVASHVRSSRKGRHITATEHMPEKHRQMGDWTPDRFIRWAEKIGPSTGALITAVLNSRRHPQQAYRSCLGLLRLAKCYGDERLEAAAARALAIGSYSYRSVESILNHRLDGTSSEQLERADPVEHDNIRATASTPWSAHPHASRSNPSWNPVREPLEPNRVEAGAREIQRAGQNEEVGAPSTEHRRSARRRRNLRTLPHRAPRTAISRHPASRTALQRCRRRPATARRRIQPRRHIERTAMPAS